MKKITVLFTAILLISCKNEKQAEKEISTEIINSDKIILEQKEKTELVENNITKDILLDSIWIQKIFKNTPLTSDKGQFYSGYKSKVYRRSSDSIENKKLNTYIKKVDLEDGSLSEIYAVLLSENEDILYDLKWIGNNGQIVECTMNTEVKSTENGLIANYSLLCYDGHDEKLDKEFMADKITTTEITVDQNLLSIKVDTITKRSEIK